ncbi:hypothetical protein AVEN_263931-1 [Araneus ventricosus]|uniref:Uncharacterized protein n=1 Tax=Araneus ventricosus TaxID=182803 RepID=A0A4Y2WR16_ARAVE|nr:hypothetical protein AVEN_263931-1 [Araneus ventricosus]
MSGVSPQIKILQHVGKPHSYSEVQLNFRKIRPELRVCPQTLNRNPTREKMQVRIRKSSRDFSGFCPTDKQKPKTNFLSNAKCLVQSIGISFHKASKVRRPPFILTIATSTKADLAL